MSVYALGDRRPHLPPGDRYWIAPTAVVVGDVRLGTDVSVWFGAVLRGDNDPITIGAGSNVQDGTVVHSDPGFPTLVGAGCTIGHRAILHGCTLGDNTLVGMGATILNGAIIGKNCIVGAKALVTEGKVFPDNSLIVGAPARVVRSLDDNAVARLRLSAAHYVANWQRYAVGLTVL
ncbi:gamma carbonic anhydrase family protein [Peteryoungia ipomoeae]|uniref:Gamma carbonic anhydrase family protein n=1 Tax=Peteryoungia ipomoeae TaxID=1210932 RepID=A0A4S8PB62_9HYPH|nr:gamma carbonic anhydrase family protein [Peteryoungia ipomoeae]THV25269.1 gamma carbonic anhydrase family protein [Peteryoungia ipomoeae]